MKFVDILNETDQEPFEKNNVPLQKKASEEITEEAKKPEEILRRNGFKIKFITSTSFGTQIDFAKNYDPEQIKDVLSDFNIKIKDKSVFIVN